MMRNLFLILLLAISMTMIGCSGDKKERTPNKNNIDVSEIDGRDKSGDDGLDEGRVSVEEIIIGLFADKFDMDEADITLQDVQQDDSHATGMVIIGEGGPGGAGGFLASNVMGDWEIVWDGNGVIDCVSVEGYDFPASMLPSCFNEDGVVITFQEELLKQLLVAAFLREPGFESYSEDDIELTIDQRDDYHVKGGILIDGGGPGNGGGFLAANTVSGWVLVWHGNGVYMCDDLAPYDFPDSMSEGCYAG